MLAEAWMQIFISAAPGQTVAEAFLTMKHSLLSDFSSKVFRKCASDMGIDSVSQW